MSEDKKQENVTLKSNADGIKNHLTHGGEEDIKESEKMSVESLPPKMHPIEEWIKTNRRKHIVAGLSLVLITSSMAWRDHAKLDQSEAGENKLKEEQSFEARAVEMESKSESPQAEEDLVEEKQTTEKRQVATRILGDDGVKAVLENELQIPSDKMKLTSIELIQNPAVEKYRRVASEDQEREEETDPENSIEDKLFYKVKVEVNGKNEELKSGAETGKIYYSTIKTKA